MANPTIQSVTSTVGGILCSTQIAAANTPTAVYTVGASSTAKVASATVCNSVPAAKVITNAATTNGSTTITSSGAGFTSADVGKSITGSGLALSTKIASVTNSTTIVVDTAASATATGVTLTYAFPAVPVVVSVSLLKSGDTSDGTHAVLSGRVIDPSDTLSLRDLLAGAMLGAGESVVVTASVAAVVDIVLTGAVSS